MKRQLNLAVFALVFAVIFAGHVSAQRFWAGAGSNPATAGSGTWDNSNTQWSSTFPGYTAAIWDSNIANFNGTGGGTVTIGANIIVSDINFGANAGAFTLLNSGSGQGVFVSGAGITNNSANTQTINNSGTFSSTQFVNSATAANAFITNSGSSSGTFFIISATAANASITNSGTFSSTQFFDSATAANASITNSGIESGTFFQNSATAANASITNSGSNSGTFFFDSATAANATITNNGSSSDTQFFNGATAANASITNSGSSSGASFLDSATAANASITNSGTDSFTLFFNSATASNATITNSGANSFTAFLDSASGGNASLINANPSALIDISFLTTSGTTAGSIAGNGFLNLGSKNLAVGSNNTSTTFSGVIQDGGFGGGMGGSLTKVGTGTLTLSGANTYTGGTTINEGVLSVGNPNALGTGHVVITSLGGASTLQTAGETPLTFNVGDGTDDFLINPGPLNILRMKVGGLSSGVTTDLMNVGRFTYLSGGELFVHQINNFMPLPGDQVTIIHTEIRVFGAFDSVASDFPGLIQPVAVYFLEHVDVVFALTSSFQSQGTTPNQEAVGEALDHALSDNCVPALVAFVGNQPLANLPHDYDLIAPEELAAIYEISFSQAVVHNNHLMRRMDDIRAGSNGYCGPVVEIPRMSGKDYNLPIQDKNVAIPDKNVAPAPAMISCPENHWGVFVTGSGDFVNVGNDDSNARGYDITTGDFTLGADYRIGEHFAIGIDGGYSAGTADLVDNGQVEVDGGRIGGYATVFGNGFFGSKVYVDLAGSGGWNSYDTRRTGLQDLPVRGSTDGSEFNAILAYGADWTFNCLNIGTWSTLQYTNVSIDKFTENGSLAPLEIQDQDEDSFRATTGIRASYDIKFGHCGIIRPEVRAAWQHEYNDRAYPIDARFIDCPTTFRVLGPSIGRDAALVGAGVNMQWNSRLSTYVYYDGVLGRENYDKNAVSGGVRVGF